jgi:glucose-6-phosphate-specific signal transduction histidine kinase
MRGGKLPERSRPGVTGTSSPGVELLWGNERLTLTVRDRGGLSPGGGDGRPSFGRGLTSLAERITLVGGRLETGAISGGFRVRAELPISTVAAPRGVRALSSGDEQ